MPRSRSLKGIALQQLRKAFQLSIEAKRKKSTDLTSIAEEQHQRLISRRKFVLDVAKGAAVISAVGLYEACTPVNKKTQPVIAIVGGGIAGLHAAYVLKNAGYTAQIYEGSPRVGGRIMSVNGMMGEGLWTEMGGEFIDSNHTDMLNLAAKFNLPLIDRKAASEMDLKEFTYYFEKKQYQLADVLEAIHPYADEIQKDIDSLSDEISFEKHTPEDVALDNMSIEEYLEKLGINGWFREFINSSYTAEYGMEISQQSAINFLSIFEPGDDKEYKLYGESDERYSIAGGNLKVCDALAAELGDHVLKEHLLTAINQNSDKRYVLTFKVGGAGEIDTNADIVLLTLPFTLLREVDIKIPLPEWKINGIKNLGYGTNSKLFVGVKERIWRQQGYAGYAFSDNLMRNGYDHTQMQNNNRGNGGYTIFLGGKTGIDCGNIPMEDLQQQYLPALDEIFPGVAAQFNGNFQKWHWPSFAFSKASYTSYSTGQYTTLCGTPFKPVDNLYFAGEHCSYEFQGFMNGGAETGRHAAEMIVANLKS